MKPQLSALLIISVCSSSAAIANQPAIGITADSAAYSAKQIKNTNPSAPDGVYWFDVDGAGGLAPFQAFADMSSQGGGWTMVHSGNGSLADMDAIDWNSILATYGQGQFRIAGSGDLGTFDAYYSGGYSASAPVSFFSGGSLVLPSIGSSGAPLVGPIIQGNHAGYSVYVRESITPAYTAPVPEADTYAMMLAGLGLVGFVAHRRKQSQA